MPPPASRAPESRARRRSLRRCTRMGQSDDARQRPTRRSIRAARSRILLLCDHATNIVPPEVNGGDLGLPAEEMGRHIAYDIGAARGDAGARAACSTRPAS